METTMDRAHSLIPQQMWINTYIGKTLFPFKQNSIAVFILPITKLYIIYNYY